MKILLINVITREKNLSKDRIGIGYPNGVAYVGAYLYKMGHDVSILDNNQAILTKKLLADYLKKSEAEIIGISAFANSYNQVIQLSRLIKETTEKPIVLGGPLAT